MKETLLEVGLLCGGNNPAAVPVVKVAAAVTLLAYHGASVSSAVCKGSLLGFFEDFLSKLALHLILLFLRYLP